MANLSYPSENIHRRLCGLQEMTMNVHSLIYVAENPRSFGSLDAFSVYS